MSDDRAVSVAVTHVLTIGITTILISGLLLGAGSVLDQQREATTEGELRAIGDRIATDMVTAADRGQRTEGDVTVRTRYDATMGGGYTVTLDTREECFAREHAEGCLEVRSHGTDAEVEVPVTVSDAAIENSTATSGSLVVEYDHAEDEVRIRDR